MYVPIQTSSHLVIMQFKDETIYMVLIPKVKIGYLCSRIPIYVRNITLS